METPTELVARNECPKEIKMMLDMRYEKGWELCRIISTESNIFIYLFSKIK